MGDQTGGGDLHGKRQEPADAHDLGRGCCLGGNSLRSGNIRQKLKRLRGLEHIQVDDLHPSRAASRIRLVISTLQPARRVAATDLPLACCIVEDDENAQVMEEAAVERRALLQLVGIACASPPRPR